MLAGYYGSDAAARPCKNLDHPLETTDLNALARRLQDTLPDARLDIHQLPQSELRLALINADFQTGPLPADVMRAVIEKPAYWAFCWGSGLALAQHLLATPDLLANRSVVDIGSGSGVAAIAAAACGARRVWACDTDANARAACTYNARLNGVELEPLADLALLPERADVALLADVLYDKSNLPLLELAAHKANLILVADSRIQSLPDTRYEEFAQRRALTYPNLGEFDEFGTTRLFRRVADAASIN